jgi:hypothetical protein
MSAPQRSGNNGPAWAQELKSNRKTQISLAMFLIVAGYLGYELFAPKAGTPVRRRPASLRNFVGQSLEGGQAMALKQLPNLAGLHQAGELPNESRMYRDLFGLDGPPPPPPPPPPPTPPPPPKPPPTPEEIAARELQAAMDRETRAQPTSYQLIGFIQGRNEPLLKGIFKNGNEIDFFTVGNELTPNWPLVALNEEGAMFQNTKFEALKFMIPLQTTTSGRTSNQQQVTNQY